MSRNAVNALGVRRAGAADCQQVWLWRNEPGMREAAFTTGDVLLAQHERWYADMLQNSDIRLYIGSRDGSDIGFVRFDLKPDEVHISVTVDVTARGRGEGTQLIREACRTFRGEVASLRIVALIRPENGSSRAAFAKAGFQPAGHRQVGSVEAIVMALP